MDLKLFGNRNQWSNANNLSPTSSSSVARHPYIVKSVVHRSELSYLSNHVGTFSQLANDYQPMKKLLLSLPGQATFTLIQLRNEG